MTVQVAILGASGYAGIELVRLLFRHPRVAITHVTADRQAGKALSEVFPQTRGMADWTCEAVDLDRVAERAEVVFLALPHLASMAVAPGLLERGRKVLDLSADFRLKDAAVYEAWYDHPHTAPALLAEAVYGLAELNREAIRRARLVAVPGCYPTSAQLALAPLLTAGLIDPELVVVDSKSGVTGAGRSPGQEILFSEVADGIRAYKAERHRHTPEMEQELSRLAGTGVRIRFTPQLSPHLRGILSACHVRPRRMQDAQGWRALFVDFYRDAPFVRILPPGRYPGTHHVRGSNYCDIGFAPDPASGWLTVMAAIDNLVKGAAGQAVQDMNLMLGFPESEGLEGMPLFP